MIFKSDSVALILEKKKTQTRRPVNLESDSYFFVDKRQAHERLAMGICAPVGTIWVKRNGRLMYLKGRTYAVCPGRGKRAVCRIRITGIRCERVCDISDKDVPAEGLRWDFKKGRWVYGKTVLENRLAYPAQNIAAYMFLWRSMYPKSDSSELVWVLTFELVGESDVHGRNGDT